MRTIIFTFTVILISAVLLLAGGSTEKTDEPTKPTTTGAGKMSDGNTRLATFGGGCFWCVEAVFQLIDGVESAVSGYGGGETDNPKYEQVCSGRSGHAEIVQITFDPAKASYIELLDTFFSSHDPTTLNRQGNDKGTQYRSVIYYHDDQQKAAAETKVRGLEADGVFDDPIVTEISPAGKFYSAEKYHQDYYALNPRQPYCQLVVRPKVEKFKKKLAEAKK
jgi:peptide-methionine (S)-S-oxide reductase